MEGGSTLGGEHTVENKDVLQSCAPEIYILTNAAPINLIKNSIC